MEQLKKDRATVSNIKHLLRKFDEGLDPCASKNIDQAQDFMRKVGSVQGCSLSYLGESVDFYERVKLRVDQLGGPNNIPEPRRSKKRGKSKS